MECIQCGNNVTTEFCPKCGQRAEVRRLTVRDTLADFWTSVMGFDGMFLRTIKDLTRRPGFVATSYIKGIRFRYFGPIGYFFFMITLLLLWLNTLGMDFEVLIREQQESMLSQQSQAGVNYFTKMFSDNLKWVLFLAVPFQAIAARYLFFRKSGYNLMEHSVPLFYISGHLFWLTMLMILIRSSIEVNYSKLNTIDSVLSFVYFGFTYSDLMRYQSRVKSFFKGIGVYFGGMLLFIFALIIAILVVVVLLAWFNPESLRSIATPSGS